MAKINGDTVTGAYKINGVAVLDPQIPYKFELDTTGVWYRNMNADRCGYVVANMKKLYWIYNGVSEADMQEILSIIYSRLESGFDTFTITSYIIGKGSVTDTYYLGQPWTVESVGPGLYKFEFHWIQDKGKKAL